MERKIGEIFEHNGEWLQCVKSGCCKGCAFQGILCDNIRSVRGICVGSEREDRQPVIFKKLEKVGEPYEYFIQSVGIVNIQEYILANPSYIWDDKKDVFVRDCHNGRVAIEIKQNKEDMEESKPKLKEFDLEATKAGKPVCTRDGRKARIICFDAKGDQPIIALVTMDNGKEFIETYHLNGRFNDDDKTESGGDLMMLPEKKEGWVNLYDDIPIYDTKEEALNRRSKIRGLIDTVKYVGQTKSHENLF